MRELQEKDILFGAAYYPEYMPYDRLQEDIAMMQKAGMNTIRIAESTWSTLEPAEGVYDFSYIDKTLAAAEEAGMYVIIGTPTYAIPSWLEKKCPEVMVFDGYSRKKYGKRQIMDIVHPVFRKCAENVICKLLEHTANVSCVIGFQIDNETKHYGTASPQVQRMFVEYLKTKFHTTEQLNEVFGLRYWSNSISDWSDFPDMAGCIHGGLACEFAKFQRSLAAEYLVWQSELVKKYKRQDQFITHNFDFEWKKFGADIAQDGYSYGVQPDINHYEASKAVTIAGTDIYHPTQDGLTGAEIGFGGDSIRTLKDDAYIVLECQAQAFKYWTPYPGQLRLHGYSHLASGAAGVLYWNWHSIHDGYETYWKGVLSHDLSTNPVYEEAGEFGREIARFGRETLCISRKNQVAVVIDNQSLSSFNWFPIDKDLSYNDVVRWMYDCLYEMNISCDIIDIHQLEEKFDQEQKPYQMIVTPALYSVSDAFVQKMKGFVQAGGVVVSSFKSFVADRQLSVYSDVQPHGMTDCFGMSYNQFTEPGRATVAGENVFYFAELLKPDKAQVIESYEHKYWGKYAAITKNAFGQGYGYYIGCYVTKERLKKIFKDAVVCAQVQNYFDDEIKWPVIIRSGINEKKETIHYALHYSEEAESFICPFEKVEDLLSGNIFMKGQSIPMKDWGVRILKEYEGEQS